MTVGFRQRIKKLANGNPFLSHVKSFRRICSEWRFTVLLIVIVLLNMIRVATIDLELNRVLMDTVAAVFLIAATLSLCVEKRSRTIALILGIPASLLTFVGVQYSKHSESIILMAGRGVSILFLAFTIAIILRTLLNRTVVSRDSIAGAFCGYVLIGITFAEAFCLLESIVPNSFQVGTLPPALQGDPSRLWLALQYFSFTTLTTLGFGDILPISPMARGLVIWEAICGQFYLAVLVAGLVNVRAARIE